MISIAVTLITSPKIGLEIDGLIAKLASKSSNYEALTSPADFTTS
jgi:hypothetical protein